VHYWTGKRVQGPTHVLARAPLGQPAIYVRANTPVPLWPAALNNTPRLADQLTWLIFVAPGAEGSATLFDDAGDGYGFERGEYARHSVRCLSDTTIELRFEALTGEFDAGYRTVELDVRGLDRPGQVSLDGQAVTTWEFSDDRLLVTLPASRAARTVQITGRPRA
jgi:alpha-glucosidase